MLHLIQTLTKALVCLAFCIGLPALAQSSFSLIADQVSFDQASETLDARGNVRVYQDGATITATRLMYDQRTGELTLTGPLTIEDADGSVINAEAATLSDDLKNGIVRGATLLLEEQFQLRSDVTERVDGRFVVLANVVGSTCQICERAEAPIWQIRADRAVHDTEQKRIYFENARLDFYGLPVLYLPSLRIPDPTVDRATGLLVPRFAQSSRLGYGIRLPYYIVLNDYADMTLTPFYSTLGGFVLEAEYRQRFKNGGISFTGAVTERASEFESLRSYIKGDGQFDLANDLELDFGLFLASDDSFLSDFGYSSDDRLNSFVRLSRTRENQYAEISGSRIQSLRENEVDTEIPFVTPEIYFRQTGETPGVGGKYGLNFNAVTLLRADNNQFQRIGFGLDWQKSFTAPNGMIFKSVIEADTQLYSANNHQSFGSDATSRQSSLMGLELRWPLARQTENAYHVIEPTFQVARARQTGTSFNEDSRQVEYEDTNLFSFDRFPGEDLREVGDWVNLGVTYHRYDAEGWDFGITVGRVFRAEGDSQQFADANTAGLRSRNSDYVSLIEFQHPSGYDIVNRTLFSDTGKISKNELQLKGKYRRAKFDLAYTWLEEDIVVGNSDVQHEISGKLTYKPNRNWDLGFDFRENLETNRPIKRGVSLEYKNECVLVDFSVSRRYSASGTVRANEEYGLFVELLGVGAKAAKPDLRQGCGS